MNTLKQLKESYSNSLKEVYPPEEIQSFIQLLSKHLLGWSAVNTILHQNEILKPKDIYFFQVALDRLKKQEPIQYIIGETAFYGLTFKVTPDTLIPRPETEELVSWILENNKNNTSLKVLDIGTGSGCIAISLAKNLEKANVTAIDISKSALEIAKQNASINKVMIKWIKQDILNTNLLPSSYDIIVSNPPYVRETEKQFLQKNVLDFEPAKALFVSDENPLLFYDAIASLALQFLKPSGELYFEINEYLGEEVSQMLRQKGFKNCHLKKDFFDKNRMIYCTL